MALLSSGHFAEVLEPLRGKRLGFIRPDGNVGDRLIEMATFQLFQKFGLRWQNVTLDQRPKVDHLVFGGGGNMGSLYKVNWDMRGRALSFGIPITVLPQSFSTREDRSYHRVFVRERRSFDFCPGAVLAPDMALGLDYSTSIQPEHDLGVFIRRDRELHVRRPWRTQDPVRLCKTPEEYLQLAAQYRRIITDRLHFAISGLILGRDTTILPNSYHKNRSMYETWLRDLGCKYADSLSAALRGSRPTILRRLTSWATKQPAKRAA